MKLNTTKLIRTAALGIAALLLASCNESKDDSSGEASSPKELDPAIAAVFVDTEPAGAVTVTEVRKTAKPGDTVTVSGKIAGAVEPFSEQFATIVLSDVALETCDLIPGDSCETPWDACCADPETIKASRLSLQIMGEDGRPVPHGLKGANGLKELDALIVTGSVAEGSTAENLIINVQGIYKKGA